MTKEEQNSFKERKKKFAAKHADLLKTVFKDPDGYRYEPAVIRIARAELGYSPKTVN